MTPTFNLLLEPWIPVVTLEGATREVGLREALAGAHRYAELRDAAPVLEFGLYRLLTALVLDIFRPEIPDDVSALLEGKEFPAEKLGDYFAREASCFDLFEPERPFLQCASLRGAEQKPMALLNPAIPSGSNANHFHHRGEMEFAICPAAAARLLASVSAFMVMGGAGLSPSINGAPPWYVLIRGRNLFETLVLNCPMLSVLSQAVRGLGIPAWRRKGELTSGRATQASLLEALTWQPRRILLTPSIGAPGAEGRCSLTGRPSAVLVRTMAFTAGAMVGFSWRDDPSVAYREGKDGMVPVRPREGREIWRDSGPLALNRQTPDQSGGQAETVLRPAVVRQFDAMRSQGWIDPNEMLVLHAYGMRTDLKNKVFEWQTERLELPAALVCHGRQFQRATEAMDQADRVAYYLRQAIRRAYPRDGKSNKNAFGTLIETTEAGYWRGLHSKYLVLLRSLAGLGDDNPETELLRVLREWEDAALSRGLDALREAIDDLDTDRRALERQVKAHSYFYRTARAVFHPLPPGSRRRAERTPTEAPSMKENSHA